MESPQSGWSPYTLSFASCAHKGLINVASFSPDGRYLATAGEDGLVMDARGAWDWAISHGAKPDDILLVGMSLGTGVASKLGAQLATEGMIFYSQ